MNGYEEDLDDTNQDSEGIDDSDVNQSSSEDEDNTNSDETKLNVKPQISRPRTAKKINNRRKKKQSTENKTQKDKYRKDIKIIDSIEDRDSGLGGTFFTRDYDKERASILNDIRTHELMLRSASRDFLMVQDAPVTPGSPYSRETGDSGFKVEWPQILLTSVNKLSLQLRTTSIQIMN